MPYISKTANRLTGQPMFKALSKVKTLEREGREIIHFEIGDQKNYHYRNVVNAMKKSLDNDEIYYTESQGFIELREEICEYIKSTRGFSIIPDQVVIAPANALINYVIQCTCDVEDNLLLPNPGFCSYVAAANAYGINYRPMNFCPSLDFRPNFEDIYRIIDKKTKAIIINTPNNPTGVVLSKDEVETFYNIAFDNDLYLISDEVYSTVVYSDINKFHTPSIHDRCQERTIILNSFSKSFCMSGCRVGYVVAPLELAKKIALMVETTISCVPLFVQRGAIEALRTPHQRMVNNLSSLDEKRSILYIELNSINGIRCILPEGAFYMMASVGGTGMSGSEFADYVLEKHGISVLDGSYFGSNASNYVRFSFGSVSLNEIKKATELLKKEFNR